MLCLKDISFSRKVSCVIQQYIQRFELTISGLHKVLFDVSIEPITLSTVRGGKVTASTSALFVQFRVKNFHSFLKFLNIFLVLRITI